MERHQVVAAHPRAPRHVDMRDHAALELERRIGGVVDVVLVGLAVLVPALRDMRRAEARHALDIAEQVVEHVAPVAHHVEDDAAALGLLVVPRRPLRRLPVALEHPVAELAAHREDAAEEAGVDQHLELEQAGQEQLVLHHAVLDAGFLGDAHQIERVLRACRTPASRNRCPCRPSSPSSAARREAAWSRRRRTACPSCPSAPCRDRWSSARCRGPWRASAAGRRCARPGSDRASPGRRSSAPRRPGRGSRRSSGSGAGSCPCVR